MNTLNTLGLFAAVLFGQVTLGAVSAGTVEPMIPTTTPPIVYTINYSDTYFKKPDYIDQFKAAPPDLLHMGKAVPIVHSWGPIRLYKGENQYTGGPGHTLSWENIALLSPEALAERTENIRQTLKRYHAIGIREIVPYICYLTLAGDHQKRLGFWKFYDQWDKYSRWAGPRLPHDPSDWLRRDVHGQLMLHVSPGYPYSPDYFAPLHRYSVCTNHPDWIEWHRRLIHMIAEVGYDGCFVDNTRSDYCRCYCRHCKARFRKFLDESRDVDWVVRLTKGLDLNKLALDSPDVPAELVRRWRMLRTGEHMGMLREVGRKMKPGFTIFPNGNAFPQALTTGSQCDRLMIENPFAPGIAVTEPSTMNDIAVTVIDGEVESQRFTHRYACTNSNKRIEIEADISLSRKARVGRPEELEVKVVSVGGSDRDNDIAKDFYVLLRESKSGNEVRLELEPRVQIGAPDPSGKGKRPPVVLKAAWTPKRPGKYSVHFGFNYTDGPSHSHLARLAPDQIYRTHLAELLFIQHMHARCIYLVGEALRKGWDNVEELGLAELAAFSGGGGFAAKGEPQAKYRTFFKKYPELFDGWRQTAPAAVLYAYWGGNSFSHRYSGDAVIHDHLAAAHRPFVALVDANLPKKWDELSGFRVIYLQTPDYEMSQAQLNALRDYVRQGGKVVLADEKIAINGRPACELFADGKVAIWDWRKPMTPTTPIAPTTGLAKNVRFALYRKGNRLALHVVNYNVCLLDKAKKVLDVEPMPLEIPLPEGWAAVTATCFDPDAEPQTLPCTVADGTATLTLPKTHIYKIVLLEKSQ